MGLIPQDSLRDVAAVMTHGAGRYGAHNWAGGIKYSRLYDAALRHIGSFIQGEDLDPDTGISHIAHACCCCLMLLAMTKRKPELDDRYKP
jgi:hypothetical protein